MDTNVLYYGDNLEILRKYIPDDSVDLVYLDPPFNSNATYNVLFKERTGKSSQAQMAAFNDSWHWGTEAERTLREIAQSPIVPAETKDFMDVVSKFVGKQSDMMAYLTMMCIRLAELRRVLKDTGSIYLHCDPTASHYLKILLDQIFSPSNFINEVIWKRTNAHGDAKQGAQNFGRIHDVILRYSKSAKTTWNVQYTDYDADYVDTFYRHVEPGTGRRFQAVDLTARKPGGDTLYEWNGNKPYRGRYWAYSKEHMEEFERKGKLYYTKDGMPRLKYYLDEMSGVPLQDIWDDIPHVLGNERLGYDTQKPLDLLERIIKASTNESDVVLDPFCGCGTAIVAAQKLNRKWIGIDITHLAIGLMKWRLGGLFPGIKYKVVGEPQDLASAVELANQDKYQFQWWAVSIIGGQPYGERKKGADTGIDGYLYFMDEKNKIKKAIISVKGGKNINVDAIRVLSHVVEREKAEMGVLITLEQPTKPMVPEAAMNKFYSSPQGIDYPKIQILTIEEILSGKKPEVPNWISPLETPPIAKKKQATTPKMI